MNANSAVTIITGAFATFGESVLVIIGLALTIGVGYLVFTVGLKRLLFDQSLEIGGYYLRQVPFKGYKRFHSKSWNMAHMPQ